MAGLEALLPHLYHEKQEAGSMLCAQHALNSLLQGNYFTAPDLSVIARSLDDLEESYDDTNTGNSSTNMDDTGFFSVQVLDNALSVWGLNLTRWRSERMRPYQNHPQTQLAFILNLEQHWFTLRRFGNANANIDLDEGNGHWFNLNSFLDAPEWVGKLYLGMVLQQAEAEGYSVFAVTQANPEAPLALPRTEADTIASTLPEPNSASSANFRTPPVTTHKTLSSSHPEPLSGEDGFEDEDYELQAALQASLMSGHDAHFQVPDPVPLHFIGPSLRPIQESSSAGTDSGSRTPLVYPPIASGSLPGHADLDHVAASMERNRVLLQRMREQQEFAQREMWSESDLPPDEQTALEERRARRQRQEEEEENELRRAIEESEALAKQQREQSDNMNRNLEHNSGPASTPTVYDDNDAELQAALRASLENLPAGNQHPELEASPPSQSTSPCQPFKSSMDIDDAESAVSDSTTTLEDSNDPISEALPSLDDIRRARLARFGL